MKILIEVDLSGLTTDGGSICKSMTKENCEIIPIYEAFMYLTHGWYYNQINKDKLNEQTRLKTVRWQQQIYETEEIFY